MGSNIASRRELPSELVRRADLVAVDSIEQAHIEAGDLILADSWANVVELKDVQRHYDPKRITIFKSMGLGVEDVAAGAFIYERALATPERFADRNRATRLSSSAGKPSTGPSVEIGRACRAAHEHLSSA